MMSGFTGLVESAFGGDEHTARQWVADLGRAAYFAKTRPGHSVKLLLPYREIFPHLFRVEKGYVVGINWQHRRLKMSAEALRIHSLRRAEK